MTINTPGRAGGAQGMAGSVDAGGIILGRLIVARSAIHRFGDNIVVGMLRRNVRVTTGAGVGSMNRQSALCLVDKQGDPHSGCVSFVKRFV